MLGLQDYDRKRTIKSFFLSSCILFQLKIQYKNKIIPHRAINLPIGKPIPLNNKPPPIKTNSITKPKPIPESCEISVGLFGIFFWGNSGLIGRFGNFGLRFLILITHVTQKSYQIFSC